MDNLRPEMYVRCKCGGSLQRIASAYEVLREDRDERVPVFFYACTKCGKKHFRAFMEPNSIPLDERSYLEWKDAEIAILVEAEHIKELKEFADKNKVNEGETIK